MIMINISNMKCDGCVANAQKSLQGLPGLESAEINLQQANARLTGDFDLDEALRRLADAGYPSEKAD